LESLIVEAPNSFSAVRIAQEKLEVEYGKVARRQGTIEAIVRLRG